MRYLVIVAPTGDGSYAAYAPDVPGCFTVGDTIEETVGHIRAALAFHLEGLREDGVPLPLPVTTRASVCAPNETAAWIEVAVAKPKTTPWLK